MAFNTSDTRQRAFNRIDTSNPGGSWIDEKQFNKTRPGDCRKILCGNWQEEQILEGDIMREGLEVGTLKQDGKFFHGGWESSPYLTVAVDDANRRHGFETTHRGSFNAMNSDVGSQRQPALGVRSNMRSGVILEEAKKSLSESRSQRELAMTQGSNVPGQQLLTTYQSQTGTLPPPRVVEKISHQYVKDVPITLYTGNPSTGKTMMVHGKTPSSGVSSVHSRHTYFTSPKYDLGMIP